MSPFKRAQLSALIASAASYTVLFGAVEIFHVWYVFATALGSLVGAVTNFTLNRYWTFRAAHRRWHHQAWKYALVSGGSLLLNSAGVYALTDGLGLPYQLSVILIAVFVSVLYNFQLHRRFVYR